MSTSLQAQQLADAVRHAARRFATGVTIVAVRHDEGVHALTANSFVTLSLNPALIGISIRPHGRMRRLMEQVPCFGISVLNERQAGYARHYAGRDRLGHLDPLSANVPPIVPGCAAYFVCEFERMHPIGDHDLIVGSVVRCDVGDAEAAPLIFLDGEFRRPVAERADIADPVPPQPPPP